MLPTKGLHLCLPTRDPCVQRRATRVCTHQRHGTQYVFATYVAPRDTDTSCHLPNHPQIAAISTDSEHLYHTWLQQPCAAGDLGPNLRIPLLVDRNMNVARASGCLIEDKGVTFRASYLIDPKGVSMQIMMHDLPVGRSVDESLRLVQAFQFTVSDLSYFICGGVAPTQGG